jgi:hypothetical protein
MAIGFYSPTDIRCRGLSVPPEENYIFYSKGVARGSIVWEGSSPVIIDHTPNYSYSIGVFDLFGVMACLAILCALSIHIPWFTGREEEKFPL